MAGKAQRNGCPQEKGRPSGGRWLSALDWHEPNGLTRHQDHVEQMGNPPRPRDTSRRDCPTDPP